MSGLLNLRRFAEVDDGVGHWSLVTGEAFFRKPVTSDGEPKASTVTSD